MWFSRERKLIVLEFEGSTLSWWIKCQHDIIDSKHPLIDSWDDSKEVMRNGFMPYTYKKDFILHLKDLGKFKKCRENVQRDENAFKQKWFEGEWRDKDGKIFKWIEPRHTRYGGTSKTWKFGKDVRSSHEGGETIEEAPHVSKVYLSEFFKGKIINIWKRTCERETSQLLKL